MTSTLDYIKEILDAEMNLPTGRCFAYNSAVDLPKDDKLFIVLYFGSRSPFANNVRMKETATGFEAEHSYNVVEDIEIALISRDNDARDRVHEVYMALNSVLSHELQEKYKFHLSSTGEVLENSFLEATSRMNRFDVTCRVIRAYEKQKYVNYYDKFNFKIWGNGDTELVTKTEINL